MKIKRLPVIWGVLLLPLPWFGMQLLSTVNKAEYPVRVNAQGPFHCRAYSDTSEGGGSLCRLTADPDSVRFTFTLRAGYSKPFAGIAIEPALGAATFDFSSYDSIAFSVTRSCPDTQDIKINIHTPFAGNTSVNPLHTRISEKIEPCLMMSGRISAALHDFAPPDWWCEKCKVDCGSLRRERFSRVQALIFQNGNSTPRDQEITFVLTDIRFTRNVAGRVRVSVFFLLAYYLVCIAVLAGGKAIRSLRREPREVVVAYKPLAVNNYLDEESRRIETWLGEHFQNPDLTLETAAREAGVHQKKFSQILNRKFGRNFRQYLNGIRIQEAKRLLRETDRQIADIARKVGYQTVAHFNRTFRQVEGCSPNEYRSGGGSTG